MENQRDERVQFGFWIYLMTDLLMFAVLFAVFIVLRANTYGGATIADIFNPPFVLIETLILLTSSFVCGLGVLNLYKGRREIALFMLLLTLILGLVFLGMEGYEFGTLIREGNTPQRSAFLSSFFTIVGAHGAHIAVGSLWIVIMLIKLYKNGLTHSNIRKATMAGIFWHFLDIVWIFIFTIVYLFAGIL